MAIFISAPKSLAEMLSATAGGNFAPVTKFQNALAHPAAGHDSYRVGCAPINFHKSYQALAVAAVRVFDAELLKPEHCHEHPQNLARAEVAVRAFGIGEIFVERFQVSRWSFCC